MANNKVQLANGTVLMDVTDTTALASTVKSGDIFYNAAGVRQTGTLIVDETYSIQQNLTNVTSSVDDTKVIAGNCFYTKLTPSEGYNILSVIVTMDGVDITRQVFKEEFETYNIIQNLTNVESSCDDIKTMAGTSFFANLTPFNNGTIEYIKVTMGGEDITEQVFKPGVGEKTITQNGTYLASNDNFSGYSSVIVNVSGGGSQPILQTKSVTATEESQIVEADENYDGLEKVNVGAISSSYVGSNILRRSSSDLTSSGATVSIPSGYYENNASKTIQSGSVSVPSSTVSVEPQILVSSSGLITASVTKTESISPNVSAGYVLSGSSGTININGSNNSQLTVQGAQTITPTTSQQSVGGSGKFMTGAITINPIPSEYNDTSEVTATSSDVISGKKIVDSSGSVINGELVIQHYYTGTSQPSSSTGINGDIYLMTGA